MNKDSKADQLFLFNISVWDIIKVVFFVALYFIAFRIAYMFPDAENILLAIWPASGIGLAALLLSPRRLWFVILASFFIVGNISNLMIERPLFNSIGFMIANIIESYACAWVIIRWCGEDIRFNKVKEISALIFGAIVVNAATAVVGGGTAWLAGISTFFSFWKFWWIADGLGILILAPLFVTWGTLRNISIRDNWKLGLEAGIFMAIWYKVSELSFRSQASDDPFTSTPYLLVALLSYAAMRLGQRGVTVALAILSVIAITSETIGIGPSPLGGSTMNDRLLLLQVFLSCIAITGYIVAASYSESRSSERSAREEQSRIRVLGDNIPDGMVYQAVREHDGSTRFLYVSAGIEKLYGISAQEGLNDSSKIYDLFIEEDRSIIYEAEKTSAREMSTFNVVARLQRTDGELRWMQLSSSPRRLEDGRILWDGIQMDITERRKAEQEALLNSEIFKNVSEGIFLVGMDDGIIKHTNSEFEKMFGYEPGELIGKDVSILNAPTDKTPHETKADIMEILRKTGEWHGEIINIRKDGNPFWSYSNVSLFDHPEFGRVIVSVHTDITGRKLMEKALQDSEEKYRNIVETANEGIWMLDISSRTNYVNSRMAQMLGYTPGEMIGKELFDFMDTNARIDAEKYLERCKHGIKEDHDFRFYRKDGTDLWAIVSTSPVFDDKGKYSGTLGMVTDISVRKKAEEDLRESEGRLKRAQKAAHLGNWEWDLTTNKLYWAEENYRIHGIDPHVKPSYEAFIQVVDPAEHEYLNKAIEDAIAGKRVFDIDYTAIRPDNRQRRVINSKADVIRNSSGKPVKMVGTVQDITDRKRIQEELQIALIKYQTVFSAFPLGITVADRTGKIIEGNPMAEKLLGLSQEEHRRRKIDGQEWTIVRPDGTPFPAQDYASTRALAENRVVENVEMGIVKAHGEITWINVTAAPLPVEIGGVVITYNDITKRKKAEAELHSLNQTLKAAQSMAKVGYWNYDIRAKMPTWSEQMFVIFGLDPKNGVPKYDDHRKIWHPDDWDLFNSSVHECEKGRPYNIVVRILFPDKSIHYINTQGFPRYNEKGEIDELFGTSQDITDSKQKEEILRASLEEKTVLLNEIHHRVKNNLQIVSSLLSLQSMRTKNKEAIDTLRETGNRVYTMALLHETLYRSGNLAKVSFSSYIENICYHIIHSYGAESNNIKLEQHLADITLDLDQAVPCGLIITELVSNALKHAFPKGQKGRIIVELKELPDNLILLKVADDGIGLPPGLDINKSETLGLKLVSILTEKLKGNVEIIRDKGTIFQITFMTRKEESKQH